MVTGRFPRWVSVVSIPRATPSPKAILASIPYLAARRRGRGLHEGHEHRRQRYQRQRHRQHALPGELHQLIVAEAWKRAAHPHEDDKDDRRFGDEYARQK